ncbi:SGNH/GDSL hydrolase family protein [Blastococcus sp. SYSU D01042]
MAREPDPRGPGRGLPVPSRTEGLILAVLLLVTAAVVGFAAWQAASRTPGPSGPYEYVPAFAPGSTQVPAPAAPSTPPPAPVPAAQPVLAFYGDWYVSGTDEGGRGPAGWPAILSARTGAVGTEPHAVPDAGYVTASAVSGDTFVSLAEELPEPDADVTVVLGGRNDYRATSSEITAAALRAYDAIRVAAPQTELLVVGPVWDGATVPQELLVVRDALRRATTEAGVTFVDPLEERWFAGGAGLIAGDGISPTDQGHLQLADRIEPALRQLLAG